MKLITPVVIAFSMYSRLPMPHIEWGEDNMRYAMCAFPLVGLVQGALAFLWALLVNALKLNGMITAAGFTMIPIAVNGGIHLDGLCDTADALASHAPKEKKLEILKDPRTGAFGVISLVCHMLMVFALYSGLKLDNATLLNLGGIYMFSRSLSGIAVIVFPNAKKDGTLHSFSKGAVRSAAGILHALALLLAFTIVWVNGYAGALTVVAGIGVFGAYRFMSGHYFGGVTGDLAGWFLQNAELCMLAALVLGGMLL